MCVSAYTMINCYSKLKFDGALSQYLMCLSSSQLPYYVAQSLGFLLTLLIFSVYSQS